MTDAFIEAGFSGYITKTSPLDEVLKEVMQALGIANQKLAPENGVAIPATARRPDNESKSPVPARAEAAKRRLILLADDYADDREMYAHFLQEKGFRVALASDG